MIAAMLSAASVAPTPDTSQVFDENTVTPGVAGFVAIILIAAAVVLLAIDMTRRIRRTRYRGEIAEKLDAEELDARAAALSDDDLLESDGTSGTDTDTDTDTGRGTDADSTGTDRPTRQ